MPYVAKVIGTHTTVAVVYTGGHRWSSKPSRSGKLSRSGISFLFSSRITHFATILPAIVGPGRCQMQGITGFLRRCDSDQRWAGSFWRPTARSIQGLSGHRLPGCCPPERQPAVQIRRIGTTLPVSSSRGWAGRATRQLADARAARSAEFCHGTISTTGSC